MRGPGLLAAAGLSVGGNAAPLSIGAQHDGERPFLGGVDDTFLFARALDAAEVASLVAGAGDPDPDPDPTLPDAPKLKTPANRSTVTGTSATMEWYSVSGATEYIWQATNDLNGDILEGTVSGTKAALSGILADKTYWWRVAARNDAGQSDWSSVWKFYSAADDSDPDPDPDPDDDGDDGDSDTDDPPPDDDSGSGDEDDDGTSSPPTSDPPPDDGDTISEPTILDDELNGEKGIKDPVFIADINDGSVIENAIVEILEIREDVVGRQ